MEVILLECLLMDNGELMFDGKSLGFLTEQQIAKYVKKKENVL